MMLMVALSTQRLQSISFLVMTYVLLRDYNLQPKKELLWSLCLDSHGPHLRFKQLLDLRPALGSPDLLEEELEIKTIGASMNGTPSETPKEAVSALNRPEILLEAISGPDSKGSSITATLGI